MRLTILTFMDMVLAVAAFASGQAASGNADMRVTSDHSITATLAPGEALGAHRIVIEVDAYQPSRDGPVTAVVEIECGGHIREIGRFSVFPDTPFAAAEAGAPQRFGFDLPPNGDCGASKGVVVKLEPVLGKGNDASMTISAIRLE